MVPDVREWFGRVAFTSLTAGVLVFGYEAGFVLLNVHLAVLNTVLTVALLQAEFAVLSFGGFVLASTLVFLVSTVLSDTGERRTADGSVTAIVPVYRDRSVLHRSVRSLLEANYDDVDICIVCEPGDEPTIRRAEELARLDDVEYLLNTENSGSKAGAINYAIAETDSEYVSIHDADEVVHPEFLPAAVSKLQAHDVVQGRTVPEPDGVIESLAYYESVLLSYVSRRLLYLCTDFRMAASRAIVCRRETIESLDGYDETMLTEDFDFAYRCYRNRVDVSELLAYPSQIDAAHTLTDWWGQRKRWMTGYAQVLHRLAGTVRPVTDYRNLTAAAICASTVLGSVLLVTMLSKLAVLIVAGSNGLVVLPLGAIAIATLSVRLRDYAQGLVPPPTWYWLFVPVLLPVYSLSAIRAVFEYLLSWNGQWYHVSKEL